MELHDPCPIRHVRQTNESVRRLSYRCGDSRFRGVLSNGVRMRVGVRNGRESWRGGGCVNGRYRTRHAPALTRTEGRQKSGAETRRKSNGAQR